jgi:drug/metabolite transporter (DMT)-like permease
MTGIGLKVSSVVVLVLMATMLKATSDIPVGQQVFFRSFFAIFPVAVYLSFTGELADGFRTRNLAGHIKRGLFGVVAMALTFVGLSRLPLPESISIGYAMPLFIVVLSAILLKEQVRVYRWSAVLLGLVGVLIIMWPRLTLVSGDGMNSAQTIGAIAAFVAAICAAFAQLQVRRLVNTENTASIVMYFSLTASVLSLLTIPFGWVWPDPLDLALLIGVGLAGGVGQILLTASYRYADMSIIAPFEYTSIVLSVAIGYLVFADIPTVQMLVGGAIVVASGIFVILREHRLGLERKRAKEASSP